MHGEAEAVWELLVLNRPADALDRARRALAADPDQPIVLALCAYSHLHLDDAETALLVAEQGCAEFPDTSWMHQIRGLALSALGRKREAVDAMGEAVRLDPLNAHHLVASSEELIDLASALPTRAAEVDELLGRAMRAAERARALAPQRAHAHFGVAKVHLARRDWSAAANAARDGLHLDPDDPIGHEIAGAAAAGRHDVGRAADHFVAAARADPRSSNPIDLLRGMRRRTPLWITVAVLLGAPVLAWLDGTWSDALWIVVAIAVGLAGWILWNTRGRLSDDARTALRRSRRLR